MTRPLAPVLVLALLLGAAGSAAAQSIAALAEEARQVREQAAPAPAVAAAPVARSNSAYPDVILSVPVSPIGPGETITSNMLEDKLFSAAEAQRYPQAAARSGLVGKVAKRMLTPGMPVPFFAVGEPKLVTQGVPATIRFEEGGLSIRAVGMPLESGVVGAVVRLKNVDSGHMVTGVVQPDGTVKVGG